MKWLAAFTIGLSLISLFLFNWIVPGTAQSVGPSEHSRRRVLRTQNKKGVHLLLTDRTSDWTIDQWSDHMAAARDASGEWGYVTQLIRSDDYDRNRWQQFMNLCKQHRLIPIIRLATVQNSSTGEGWEAPPQDSDGTYKTFSAETATFLASLDWPTDQHIVIVANEPNHGSEWGGQPNPAEYARFLIDMANAIHKADRDAIVLNAGFDHYAPHTNGQSIQGGSPLMDAETFIDEMVEAQPFVFSYIDAWASHPYPLGPFAQPPYEQTYQIDQINGAKNPNALKTNGSVPNRGVNGYEWEMLKLESLGVPPLPIFITETGWRHRDQHPEMDWPASPVAALYLDLALRGNLGRFPSLPETGWTPWQDDNRVVAVTPFAFDGDPAQWDHSNWLILDESGNVTAKRCQFYAWRSMNWSTAMAGTINKDLECHQGVLSLQ